jgi:hypothetical protein
MLGDARRNERVVDGEPPQVQPQRNNGNERDGRPQKPRFGGYWVLHLALGWPLLREASDPACDPWIRWCPDRFPPTNRRLASRREPVHYVAI